MKEMEYILKKLKDLIIAMDDGVTLITAIYQYFLKNEVDKNEKTT